LPGVVPGGAPSVALDEAGAVAASGAGREADSLGDRCRHQSSSDLWIGGSSSPAVAASAFSTSANDGYITRPRLVHALATRSRTAITPPSGASRARTSRASHRQSVGPTTDPSGTPRPATHRT